MNIMQTKPLRSYGIDVTQMSLQPILDELGIDRQVKNMSQAEKEILRYLATLKQAQIAMGDLANTIESPSNQMKIFRQQLIETKVALTSLFMGTFANVLPYANAILMVIKEISKAIADMFGIELTDYNSGIASQEGIYDGIADSADDANKAVKELKRQVLGFDEIHNINENKDSGNGSNLTGGIDQRLLDAITGYDNGMDKVRMKATEIRDRIMEWLGFTKEIDPLTGEVGFKLQDGETRFKKILDFVKKIKDVACFALDHADTIIKTIIGYKILTFLSNVITKLKSISGILKDFSISGIGKGFIAVGAMELLSKTDFAQGIYKNILGDNYKGKDLFGMWGEIGSGISEVNSTNKANKLQSYNNIIQTLTTIDYAKGKGIDTTEIEKFLNDSIKEYYDKYQLEKDYAYNSFLGTGIGYDYEKLLNDFKNQIYSEYSQNSSDNLIKYFGNNFLNNDDAVNITTYKDALKSYFDTITEGYDILDGYNEKINSNNEAYTNASISLGNLLTRLTNTDYEPTAEEIERINELFKQMGQISDDTAEQNYQAILKIIGNLKKNGYASDELTQKIMDNAFRQKEAEQGRTREQIECMLNLQKQLQNNEISYKEYNQKVIDLVGSFDEGNLVVGKAKITFDTLSQSVDLTAISYDEAKEAIGELKDAHSLATDSIKNGTKEQIDIITEQMTKLDTSTEEGKEAYENYSEAIKKLRQKERDDLKDLDDTYALSFANMLQTLVNSKEYHTKEGKKLAESLNGELTKIGKGIDLSGNIEDINKQLGKITGKTDVTVTVHAEQDTNSFTKIKTSISKMFGGLFSFGGSSSGGTRANGGIYSYGTWHNIPQYANGGSPSHGSVFVAGEAGAEIVGHINGKTEVLNQSQIASAIYSAVVSAMSQFGGQSVKVDLYAHTDEGVVVDRINQEIKQTGVCPINIPSC